MTIAMHDEANALTTALCRVADERARRLRCPSPLGLYGDYRALIGRALHDAYAAGVNDRPLLEELDLDPRLEVADG